MTLATLIEQAVEKNRNSPIVSSKGGASELKKIIGAVASQKMLQRTLSNMRSAGYQENSPALRIFIDRLRVIEGTLKNLEGTYGKITNLQYQT